MIRVAFAGQPNCGKSTIFTLLSGVNQHVANYPGVTVDKKTATLKLEGESFQIVDLPGTYSFSTYSMEERVAKNFLLDEGTDIIVNILDASNLRRGLYLTFQLLELGKPLVLVLNMMDVAERRGLEIDTEALASLLNVRVVKASGIKGQGKPEIFKAIVEASREKVVEPFRMDYDILEAPIAELEKEVTDTAGLSKRWLAIKLLEGDGVILKKTGFPKDRIAEMTAELHRLRNLDVDQSIAGIRYANANVIYHKCVREKPDHADKLTALLDRIVLNRWLAFPILGLIIFLVYQLSIVAGYKLTDYTWPMLAAAKNQIIEWLPSPQFIHVPLITDFGIWMTNSILALLNYLPIFLILFALIAILEDVGYMPRMAFILDRVFKRYGLHGQSTLPLILGGAFVGGCAVPGIMATKGIADERAQLATILTVPYMNCLAKVPFYTLLLGAFFENQMSQMMFYISTVTLFIALIVAKLLTSTFMKNRETAPFVMELPAYHLPTFKGVVLKAFQRVWIYIKKVMTIVVAVAVVLFVLLQYPGVPEEKMAGFQVKADAALNDFMTVSKKTSYHGVLDQPEKIFSLINAYDEYRAKRMLAKSDSATAKVDAEFTKKYPDFFPILRSGDNDAKKLNRAVRNLSSTNKQLQIAIKNEKITYSFLGKVGQALEPATRFAGFDWRVNVAFLSSFAARESAVATLGAIYEKGKTDASPEEAFAQDGAYTAVHAVAMLIFMLLSPPCIAAMVVVKLQSGSYRWMLFAIFFPATLGIILSSAFFSMAVQFSWAGIETMRYFYITMLATALLAGFIGLHRPGWQPSRKIPLAENG
ncbi:ferrous iron transport protein B [Desulfococcaceae bacterium OttesenSCG-928-F15]|nr:ferrous iron transport protein B [Desulfococcaceae bacterium OttesenSCG-928-F15]